MDKKLITPFNPELHEVVESIGFIPGDHLTINIDAHSLGVVFVCKCVLTSPDIKVIKDSVCRG